jgi:hypothetical protein
VDDVSGSIVLDHIRVVDRDVGRSLVEIVHRITAFAHYLGHQTIRIPYRPRRIVDERGLHRAPVFDVLGPRVRSQHNDVELLSLSLAGDELLFGGALFTGLYDGSVILWTEVTLQSFGSLAAAHCARDEHRQRNQDHRGDGNN